MTIDYEDACKILLGPKDPSPYEAVNVDGTAPGLLVCDHASRAVPAALGRLGLADEMFERHIAFDIGAADLTRILAGRLNTPALLAGYSRLLIDCNRQPGDPMSIPKVSDGVIVPGNQGLSEADQEARAEVFFWPYHHAITNAVAHLWRNGPAPALFSIHSFTPSLNGEDRMWDAGILWNRDPRIAEPLIEMLRDAGYHIGDNEPYSGLELAYTIDMHGGAAGLPNVVVEIRQDHLADEKGINRWADVLMDAFTRVLARPGLHQVEHF